MGEKPDQIERHIQNQRDQLGDNINELEQKVKSVVDWRAQFDERPMAMMGLAFAGGALLSALLPSTSRVTSGLTSRRSRVHSNDSWTPYTNREVAQPGGVGTSSPGYSSGYGSTKKSSETWDNLKGALMGIAVTRVGEFIEELVPGFTEHYKKAASGKPTTPFASSSGSEDKGWQKPNGGTDYASHS